MTHARPRLIVQLALLTVVAPAAAAAPDDAKLALQAFDAGEADYWFEAEGLTGRNPTLTFPAGTRVVVTLHNDAHLHHNVHFGEPLDRATRQIGPGGSVIISLDVPADANGAARYWCDPHRELGMIGEVRFVENAGDAAELRVPAANTVAALLAVVALALARGWRS